MVNRGKSGVRVSVARVSGRPVPRASLPWGLAFSGMTGPVRRTGTCVVGAVAVGKALYKQLSALQAGGKKARAALPE